MCLTYVYCVWRVSNVFLTCVWVELHKVLDNEAYRNMTLEQYLKQVHTLDTRSTHVEHTLFDSLTWDSREHRVQHKYSDSFTYSYVLPTCV